MTFVLPDYLKDKLKHFNDFPADEWPEFVTIVVEIQSKSEQTKRKAFGYYGEKAGIDAELLRSCSESLFLTMIEAVLETAFLETLEPVLHTKAPILWSVYNQHEHALREALESLAKYVPQYKSLEWRLDVQLASRACFDQLEPRFTVALNLKGAENRTETVNFTCDIPNLVHAVEVLELALSNCNNYVKKVEKSFN